MDATRPAPMDRAHSKVALPVGPNASELPKESQSVELSFMPQADVKRAATRRPHAHPEKGALANGQPR